MPITFAEQSFRAILISKIKVPRGRRALDEAKVKSLMDSIKDVGLLNPIGITPDYRLVHGAHRLAAYRELGLKKIPAITTTYENKLLTELAELDENLMRNALSKLDQSRALARRKEIYEQLHPETKAGKAQAAGSNRAQGKGKSKGTKAKDVGAKSAPTFTAATAAKTGLSQRSVQEKVAIGEKLDPKAAQMLKGTPVENNQAKLAAIAALPAEKQQEVASQIQAGDTTAVRQKLASANLPAELTKQDKARQGLQGLATVIDATRACGIYDDFAEALQQIQTALENHADEETEEWTA